MARKGRTAVRPLPLDLSRDPVAVLARAVLIAKLVLVIVVFDPAATDPFSLPKAAASRATTYVLAALLAALIVRYGPRVLRWSALYVPAAIYLGLSALAVPFAADRVLALYGAPIRLLGLTTLADCAFTMIVTATLIRTVADLRSVAIALLATSVPVLAYEGVQVAGIDPVHWIDPRIFSTLGNPAHLGAYLAIVAAVCGAILASSWGSLHVAYRVPLAALGAVAALSLGPVGSRAPVLGLAAGIAATGALVVVRSGRASARIVGGGALALVAIALVLVVSPVGERFRVLLAGGDPSREIIWSSALATIAAHPLIGVGPDNFAAVYPAVRPLRALAVTGVDFLESSPHSWVLQAAIGSGVPGAVALVSLAAVAAYGALRLVRATPLVVPLLAGLTAFLVQAMIAPNEIALDLLFWMALGLTVTVERLREVPVTAPPAPRPRSRPAGRWRTFDALDAGTAAAVVAALVLSIMGWSAVRASELNNASLAAGAARNNAEAVRLGRAAVDQDGQRAQYWATLGRAQLRAGQVTSALTSFDRAASLAPYLSGHWRNVANVRLDLAAGDRAQLDLALGAARRAVSAEPTDPFAYIALGKVYLELGDRDSAIREAQRSIDIHPEEEAYEIIGVSYARVQDYVAAEAAVRRGIDTLGGLTLRTLLAQILVVTGRPEEARPLLRYVIEQDPTREDAKALYNALPPPK